MFYPFRYTLALTLLLSLLLSFRTVWGQTATETPKNQIFLPIVAGDGTEAVQETNVNGDDLENVLPSTEFFPDEPEAALDPDGLVQSAALHPFPISTIDGTEDYQALGYPDGRKIVRDSNGKLYTVYRKKWGTTSRYRIFVAQSSDGGRNWTLLNGGQPVDDVGNYTQRSPVLAIDSQDRLHLLWQGSDVNNPDAGENNKEMEIKYTRSVMTPTGLAWEPWRNLYDGVGYTSGKLWQEHPALYVNGSNVYAVWESNEGATAHIKFRRSIDYGATWSGVIQVKKSSTVSFSRPTLMVSYTGTNNSTRYLYLYN